jgi:hypothetical protein
MVRGWGWVVVAVDDKDMDMDMDMVVRDWEYGRWPGIGNGGAPRMDGRPKIGEMSSFESLSTSSGSFFFNHLSHKGPRTVI